MDDEIATGSGIVAHDCEYRLRCVPFDALDLEDAGVIGRVGAGQILPSIRKTVKTRVAIWIGQPMVEQPDIWNAVGRGRD